MSVIYIAHGLSNSGKTSVANHLETQYGVINYHPIGFMKRLEEKVCGLPKGALDTVEGKNMPIPNNPDKTMQDLMVAMYHFYKEWVPGWASMHMRQELPSILKDSNICIAGIRNLKEVEAIADIKTKAGHALVVFNLHRKLSKRASSDEMYEETSDLLAHHSDFMVHINNNLDLAHLQSRIDSMVSCLKSNTE